MDKLKTKNKLVIIGNGFDIAHELKTSYSDFFDWMWKNSLQNNTEKKQRSGNRQFWSTDFYIESDLLNIHGYVANTRAIIIEDIIEKISQSPWTESHSNNIFDTRAHTKNKFLEKLIQDKNRLNTWNDIESFFFINLTSILQNYNASNREKLIQLNKDFEEMKNAFMQYLEKEVQSKTSVCNIKISNILENDLNQYEDILLLNFNYTKTTEVYKSEKISINHIHGELSDNKNPIIFGYGDERGEEYKMMELLNENSFFEHIKSFEYLNSTKYSELLTFIDSDSFDISVIGHSCGLTDRTLLNTLFEHKNCKSIKAHYYNYSEGGDNFQDIVRNISRSFNDKIKMRRLIINKQYTQPVN